MTIEVGKKYKNKRGEIVTILRKVDSTVYPFSDGMYTYTEGGRRFDNTIFSGDDLIEEVKEYKVDMESMDTTAKIAELEQQHKEMGETIAKLKAEAAKPKKDWPDTFEEAMKISKNWGVVIDEEKYFIKFGGNDKGMCFSVNQSHWGEKPDVDELWAKDGTIEYCGRITYKFYKFNAGKELFQWLVSDEECSK